MSISFDEYRKKDALALADLVRRREVTAVELAEVAIARAETTRGAINAIVEPLFEAALKEAQAPRPGPLSGVPFVMKDLNHGISGVRLTGGSRAFRDQVAGEDGETVRRYRQAGLNLLATSTSPEFGLTTTTESVLHGKTRNPWNLDRSAGGSSGGSAALVAAGVLPAAHATDGGGSIRVPAACCGLVGLKPSRGRAPVGDRRTEGWSGLGVSHAVTRSVRDSAALLDAVAGCEPGSRYAAPPSEGSFLAAVSRPPKRLKIAYHVHAFTGAEVDPVCRSAVLDAARLCEELGHEVEEAAPDVEGAALATAMGRLVSVHTALTLDQRALALGRAIGPEDVEVATWAMIELGRSTPAVELVRADQLFMQAAIAVGRFQQRFDLILCPTVATPPPPLGRVALDQPFADFGRAISAFSPFTALQNQTGQPAISLPLAWSSDGLPIGVQFAARIGEEALLLSFAAELEIARPWFDHKAPL